MKQTQHKLTIILPDTHYRLLNIHALDTNKYMVEIIKEWIEEKLNRKEEDVLFEETL